MSSNSKLAAENLKTLLRLKCALTYMTQIEINKKVLVTV